MKKFFKILLAFWAIAAFAGASGAAAASEQERSGAIDERLNQFFEELFQRAVEDSPEFQAQLGVKGEDYYRWGDYSDAHDEKQYEEALADLARVESEFAYEELSPESKLSYDIFKFQTEQQIRNFPWRFHEYAVTQMDSVATFLPVVLQNWHQIDSIADAEAYIARLKDAERVMDQLVANIETRNEMGIIPPAFAFPHVLNDTKTIISGAPFDDSGEENAILADFKSKISGLEVSDKEKEKLVVEAESALTGPFARGYQRFLAVVEKTQALADGNDGVWNLPDGDAFYQNQIENGTTLRNLTADEIHAYGLSEVERIQKEMRKLQSKVGVKGSLQDFFEYARTNPNNFFADTEEGRAAYLALAEGYLENVYSRTDDFFNLLPKAPLEVRAVETWREATASGAFYSQPSPDGSRPGIFYVNLADMSAQQIHTLESLAYHEGAPGHHFQIAIAQELEALPAFRRFNITGAYIEGWALYAEALGKEMGFFTDPMSDFGRLQYELLRAVRLVVDTGAHHKKWSREQVIGYMTANTPMSQADIVKETERYIAIPGQALSYKIGMRTIQDLRSKAEKELGKRFDIREFHDAVLQNGAMPLPILEQVVERYIEEAKRK
ncbi:DUF885 domain-containing protein [Hyphococcus sp.]|uniref:DUF885 domain-containing protein n=1 Tax=Hyphococcus sp. TaxID=2038636 RepID=UPI0035C6B566